MFTAALSPLTGLPSSPLSRFLVAVAEWQLNRPFWAADSHSSVCVLSSSIAGDVRYRILVFLLARTSANKSSALLRTKMGWLLPYLPTFHTPSAR
jgi:hypothetical protein